MSRFCVIGDPIAHSLSPLLQGTLLRACGLAGSYEALRVAEGETADFLRRAKAGAWAGFNATMPHKTALLPLLEELTQEAQRCGAVNVVRLEKGRAIGHNSDGAGFLASLEDFLPQGRQVAILGAGGAARAIALALAEAGAERISLLNRTEKNAAALARDCPRAVVQRDFACLGEADLLVNATPLGMAGREFPSLDFLEELRPGAGVCDLLYAPAETEFLKRAREQGRPAQNGLPLLVAQALLSFVFLTGESLDFAEGQRLLFRVLREKGIWKEAGL